MKKIFKIIPWVASVVAIIFAIAGIFTLKNENAILRSDIARAKEKNKNLILLLIKLIKSDRITLGELYPYVSVVEAKEIANKAAEAKKVSLPFNLESYFYPSGWMGDGEYSTKYLSFKHQNSIVDNKNTPVIRIEYRPGPKDWAGIYWQYPDKNWGEKPGRNLIGAKKISFYTKGERGGEIVEFKAGGINSGQYKDSFEKSLGKIILSNDWAKHVIDISQEDLTSVIGAFAWIAAGKDNHGYVITYIAYLIVE